MIDLDDILGEFEEEAARKFGWPLGSAGKLTKVRAHMRKGRRVKAFTRRQRGGRGRIEIGSSQYPTEFAPKPSPYRIEDHATAFHRLTPGQTQLDVAGADYPSMPSRDLLAAAVASAPRNFASAPYADAIQEMLARGEDPISDPYYADPPGSIVRYWLGNLAGWKGEQARQIKKELRKRLK